MRYCSACGQPVVQRAVHGDPRPRFVCLGCHAVHYQNPKILVSCIAHFGARILMCRRAQEPSRGLWTVPAGFMEEGETVEQTAVRETEEETGVKIDPDRLDLYAVLSLPDMNEVYLTLRTELPRVPDFATGSESLEVALRGEEEIHREEWAFSSILVEDRAATLFRELRTGSFGIHKIRFGKGLAPPYDTRTYGIRMPET